MHICMWRPLHIFRMQQWNMSYKYSREYFYQYVAPAQGSPNSENRERNESQCVKSALLIITIASIFRKNNTILMFVGGKGAERFMR